MVSLGRIVGQSLAIAIFMDDGWLHDRVRGGRAGEDGR